MPNERGIALIFLKPIELNKEINSERVGKFMIESAKYSYAAGLGVTGLDIFGKSQIKLIQRILTK